MIKIHLAISHTPWVKDRVLSLERLESQLHLHRPPAELVSLSKMTERLPNWAWSRLMWDEAARSDSTHCLFLQDDVIVAPNFWESLTAMLSSVHGIIALSCAHPGARALPPQDHRWYTTDDGVIGIGYVMPKDVLNNFLVWLDMELQPNATRMVNEDDLINLFAMANKLPVYHPVPTIVDHDMELVSSYENDHHVYRRPQVTWRDIASVNACLGRLSKPFTLDDMTKIQFWSEPKVPHFGRFYRDLFGALPIVLRDTQKGLARVEELRGSVPAAPYARFWVYP